MLLSELTTIHEKKETILGLMAPSPCLIGSSSVFFCFFFVFPASSWLFLLWVVSYHIYMEFVQSSRDIVTKAVTPQNAFCFYKTQGWLPSKKILICHFSEMKIFLVFTFGVHKGISTSFQTSTAVLILTKMGQKQCTELFLTLAIFNYWASLI